MFAIAGARKKLQADVRVDGPKLKIVHPEPAVEVHDSSEPSLFDGDAGDIDLADPVYEGSEAASEAVEAMSQEKVDAIRQLSTHLMELRELLSSGRQQ